MDTKSAAPLMAQVELKSRVVRAEFWLIIGQIPYSMMAFELSLVWAQLSPP